MSNKKINSKIPKIPMPKKPKKTQKPRRKNYSESDGHVRRLVEMVSDPCNSAFEQGLHGTSEGIIQRFVTNFTSASTAPFGYIVWFPSLHCGVSNGDYPGLSQTVQGSFIWNDIADGNTVPLNTAAAPFGSGAANTASSVRDPFFATSNTVNVQDGRTLAACLRIRSTSPISAIQGTIAYLDNIPANLFDLNTTGGIGAPPSVNQMLTYSRRIERLAVDTYEVKHRPHESDRFYTDTDGVMTYRVNSSATTTTALADANVPRGIGFVWTNTAGAANFLINMYKIVEWRPSPLAGVPVPRPLSIPTPPLAFINSVLDRAGDWTTSTHGSAIVNSIVNTAFTGGGMMLYNLAERYSRRGPRMLMN